MYKSSHCSQEESLKYVLMDGFWAVSSELLLKAWWTLKPFETNHIHSLLLSGLGWKESSRSYSNTAMNMCKIICSGRYDIALFIGGPPGER